MSSILFAKHVSFEHSVSSPRPVITSRREEKNNKAKVFQHPIDSHSQSASSCLISPHFAAGAVGVSRSAASFLATESTGTVLIPRLMTHIAGHDPSQPFPSTPRSAMHIPDGPAGFGPTTCSFRHRESPWPHNNDSSSSTRPARKSRPWSRHIAEHGDTLDQLSAAISTYFKGKQNVEFVRDEFRQLVQQQGVSFDTLMSRLAVKAKQCDFGDPGREIAIRDQIVAGRNSEKLHRRLLQEANIQLADAVRIARSLETSHEQATAMTEHGPAEVASLRNRYAPKGTIPCHTPEPQWAKDARASQCDTHGAA